MGRYTLELVGFMFVSFNGCFAPDILGLLDAIAFGGSVQGRLAMLESPLTELRVFVEDGARNGVTPDGIGDKVVFCWRATG